MRDLKLKLSGMGILVKYDAEIIRKALVELGYDVEVIDPEETPEWYPEGKEPVRGEGKVMLTVEHEPWGG